ncbi:PadR family transcriptional regulator [Agrococcus terreus]|uniref:PadR family transcriptional regulator n=1 Tax=Agrococcus terreus TaxID=574649 RepID=UPI00384C46EA
MSLRHAILGILRLHPATGYDLKRAFDTSVAHFWSADQSQIYRTLDRLVADGAVEVEVQPGDGRPDRRVHAIAEAGEAELRAWIAAPAEPHRPREPFLARLFFADALGADGAASLLRARREEALASLAALRAIEVGGDDLAAALRRATLANGVVHGEAELAWLDATLADLEAAA